MKNIGLTLKKFFGNKNTVTILCVIIAVLVIYFGYTYRIKQQTNPVRVPVAKVDIQPRTLITEDMVEWKEIPGGMSSDNLVRVQSEIVGMYANYNTMIPAGSPFYRSTLVTWKEMPDSAWENIPDGYTVVSLKVDTDTTYGNSIFPGNYIDLYYSTFDDTGKLLLGKLISSIEVLAVKDADGNHVFENSAELKQPNSLIFAVPENLHLLLRKASYLSGEIIPVPRNKAYTENPEATKVSSEYIQNYILSQTVILPEQSNNEVGKLEN